METEFIYWRHDTPVGIQVEEISGAEDKSESLWLQMARQIYCENGRDGFREIGHFECGAPFLFNSDSRLSISHTKGLFVAASLPKTPEADLKSFSPRTALGIDTERYDREQVIKVRNRFLNDTEMLLIAEEDVTKNILAWTAKEALFKASLNPSGDWRNDYVIISLPDPDSGTLGKGSITLPDASIVEMSLYSYFSDNHIVTIAFSPQCAKFKAKGSKPTSQKNN